MPGPPDGVVTFLFADIEGSTGLWDRSPDEMRSALASHDEIAQAAVTEFGGTIFKHTGDGFAAVFASPSAAMSAAHEIDRGLEAIDVVTLRSRFGIHTGEAIARDGDYFGPDVNKAARIMDAGNGGQIVYSAVAHALIRDGLPAGLFGLDAGEHRLKDLGEAVHLYLAARSEDARHRPLRTLDVAPNNLPVQLSSFIGRQEDIAEVAGLVDDFRLTTLTGIGGVGKTRLSLQVGAEVLHEFTDGVWLVELAGLGEPGLIAQTAITALRLKPDPARPAIDQLIDELRNKDLLMIVDNCEHLIDDVAKFVELVLRSAPQVRVLATSREGLAVGGERLWRVPSLSTDDDATAIVLFEERARLVRSDFAVTDENRQAVAELCRRLDGIPLAIELATARLKMLDVHQIAEYLGDRFRLLTGGARTSVERQRTLLAMMDWSYDLLNEHEQMLLRRLAVFVGGFSFEAAEIVASSDQLPIFEILDLLSRLVETSLVTFEEHPRPRYRLLETVRQYASDRLVEAGEADETRRRHAGYFGELVEAAEARRLDTDDDEYEEIVERELANLRAAMTWAYDADEVPIALRVAANLRQYLYNTSATAESWQWLSRGIDRTTVFVEPFEIMALAYGLTDAGNNAQIEPMGRYLRIAEETLEGVDDLVFTGMLRNAMGNAALLNDFTAAREHYTAAIEAFKAAGSARWVYTLVNLMLMLWSTASVDIAAQLGALLDEAVRDHLKLVTSAEATRATIALAHDQPEEALRLLDEAGSRNTVPVDRAFTLLTYADTYRILGRLDEGLAAHREAIEIIESVAASAFLGGRVEGLLLVAMGRHDDVVPALRPLVTNIETAFGHRASRSLVTSIHVLLAAGRGDLQRVSQLYGYWQQRFVEDGFGVMPHDRRQMDDAVDRARDAFGADEIDRLMAEGAAMEFDDLPLYTA